MPYMPGRHKTGGRKTGTPNRLTGAFREAVLHVYNGLGGHAAFLDWAKENRTEYYRIASRLIPCEMREGSGDEPIRVVVYGPAMPVLDVHPVIVDQSRNKGESS
jgi:hypothetical protein